jgi:hypothetical protein
LIAAFAQWNNHRVGAGVQSVPAAMLLVVWLVFFLG